MKITKQRLKEIIREELASLDEKNYYPTDYGTDPTRRERTPEERDRDRRERERQNQDYTRRHGKKPFGSRGTHLEEDGAKPLPGSRVKRKSDGKIGYRTSGTKTGKGSKFWDIKWAGEPVEKNVPRADFESIKDAE